MTADQRFRAAVSGEANLVVRAHGSLLLLELEALSLEIIDQGILEY
jgi:hypothetical protein